jgi:hypothetical protein
MNDLEALAAELVEKLHATEEGWDALACAWRTTCEKATCKECETAHVLMVLKAVVAMDEASFLRLRLIRKEVRP